MRRQVIADRRGVDEPVHSVDADRARERAVGGDDIELKRVAVENRVAQTVGSVQVPRELLLELCQPTCRVRAVTKTRLQRLQLACQP